MNAILRTSHIFQSCAATLLVGCILAATPAVVTAQDGSGTDDDCPIPKVEVRNVWEGQHLGRALDYYPDGAGMNDLIINALIEANRGSVQFYEQMGMTPPDIDFRLSVEGSVAGEGDSGGETVISSTITLVDAKGRVVRDPAQASFTYAQSGDTDVAARLAEPMNPLIFYIRSHQMRIRETEKSAIYASIEITPEAHAAELGEEVPLQITLTDCGPEPYPLADREVVFEHDGVGGVDPETVITDEDGRAETVFRSQDSGSARVGPVWLYENTSGIQNLAQANLAEISVDAAWIITAEIEEGGSMSVRGEWNGSFRVTEENRIDGRGLLRTTVTGSCVSGVANDPFRIAGHLEDETLHVLFTDFDYRGETDVQQGEGIACALRSLAEIPSLMEGLAAMGGRAMQSEPCPLRVPSGNEISRRECAGIEFVVRRQ